jgi:hypothetical protein
MINKDVEVQSVAKFLRHVQKICELHDGQHSIPDVAVIAYLPNLLQLLVLLSP